MNDNRMIGDLIIGSDCYKNTVNATEKAKVTSEARCEQKPLPRSRIAKAAALSYRLACAAEQPLPPPMPSSWFDCRFGYVRDPRSGYETEKLDALKAADYKAVALNVGDHPSVDWDQWRTPAHARGLFVIPWARCSTPGRVSMVRDRANLWGSPAAIINLEQENGEPRWLMSAADVVAAMTGYGGAVGVSTESWLPDNFDWGLLDFQGWTCLPQAATNEQPAWTPTTVVNRAKSLGWRTAYPSFAVYDTASGTPERNDYPWAGAFSVYTVDDLAPEEIKLWV